MRTLLDHFSFRNLDLSGDRRFVDAVDAWLAAADQLRGAQCGQDDELKRTHTIRTLNQCTLTQERFGEGQGLDRPQSSEKQETEVYLIVPLS